jgi:hypothetical protein
MRIGGKESEGVALSGMDMSLWDKTALYKLHSFPQELSSSAKGNDALFDPRTCPSGLSRHRGWKPAWRDAQPRDGYDIVIVGGGGHGLATAFYLASVHGLTRVAVVERGWIGGGNAGRNTTIIRSNYGLPGNEPFYEWAMKLWEGLEQTLNYNAMVSQRGVLVPFRCAARCLCPARQCHAPARGRFRIARCRWRAAAGAFPRFRQCPLPCPGRPVAAARGHRAA